MVGENATAEGINFTESAGAEAAGSLKTKAKAADPRETVNDVDHGCGAGCSSVQGRMTDSATRPLMSGTSPHW